MRLSKEMEMYRDTHKFSCMNCEWIERCNCKRCLAKDIFCEVAASLEMYENERLEVMKMLKNILEKKTGMTKEILEYLDDEMEDEILEYLDYEIAKYEEDENEIK